MTAWSRHAVRSGMLLLALLAVPSRPAAQGRPATVAYQVIVHPLNPVTTVDRRFVLQAFLKKTTQWEHGESLRPVDLPPNSETRRRFTETVLGRNVGAVKNYWQQMIFSGRGVPPPELPSEEAVLQHVARFPGAIGYVSGATNPTGVKVLVVR